MKRGTVVLAGIGIPGKSPLVLLVPARVFEGLSRVIVEQNGGKNRLERFLLILLLALCCVVLSQQTKHIVIPKMWLLQRGQVCVGASCVFFLRTRGGRAKRYAPELQMIYTPSTRIQQTGYTQLYRRDGVAAASLLRNLERGLFGYFLRHAERGATCVRG